MRETSRDGGKESLVKKWNRHSPDQIIAKLRAAELAEGRGEPIAAIARRLEISEPTLYRWRKQFGGMQLQEAKRLKALEKENTQLKKLVANQALDIAMLKEIAQGNF